MNTCGVIAPVSVRETNVVFPLDVRPESRNACIVSLSAVSLRLRNSDMLSLTLEFSGWTFLRCVEAFAAVLVLCNAGVKSSLFLSTRACAQSKQMCVFCLDSVAPNGRFSLTRKFQTQDAGTVECNCF